MEMILYVLLAVMVIAFWRAAGGRGYDRLLEAGHRHHRQVLRVNAKHPGGGAWKRHLRWMDEEEG